MLRKICVEEQKLLMYAILSLLVLHTSLCKVYSNWYCGLVIETHLFVPAQSKMGAMVCCPDVAQQSLIHAFHACHNWKGKE